MQDGLQVSSLAGGGEHASAKWVVVHLAGRGVILRSGRTPERSVYLRFVSTLLRCNLRLCLLCVLFWCVCQVGFSGFRGFSAVARAPPQTPSGANTQAPAPLWSRASWATIALFVASAQQASCSTQAWNSMSPLCTTPATLQAAQLRPGRPARQPAPRPPTVPGSGPATPGEQPRARADVEHVWRGAAARAPEVCNLAAQGALEGLVARRLPY